MQIIHASEVKTKIDDGNSRVGGGMKEGEGMWGWGERRGEEGGGRRGGGGGGGENKITKFQI